jgi:1,4-alpha-glucan branching enzyme
VPVPLLADPALAAARARIIARNGVDRGVPALQIIDAGTQHTLQVHAPEAERVELMADFTDWQPISLARASGGRWQVRLMLTPGVHRLNVRIDGGDWVVPAGARPEPGEFGGEVGVIVVPPR